MKDKLFGMLAVRAIIVLLPWRLKRLALEWGFGYELHPTSYIGLSWVYPGRALRMGPQARIFHGTVCRELDTVELGASATIGFWNWITGRSTLKPTPFFTSQTDRQPCLLVGDGSTITRAHYVDCADTVRIGNYSIIAGTRSTIFTHEIDVKVGRQRAEPISIGDYCYIGTCSTLLPGASISDKIVLAAGAVVRGELGEECSVYGGVPARRIADLPAGAVYFARSEARVE